MISRYRWPLIGLGTLALGYGAYEMGRRNAPADDPAGVAVPNAEGGPVQATRLRYARWDDPREGAFSLELPADWRTEGGLFRFAPVDVRAAWVSVSPDGGVRISGGDSEIPPFAIPNAMLELAGFREGSWYSPSGVNMMVRRYVGGSAFAREYVVNNVARACSGLTFTAARSRPDAVSQLNAANSQLAATGISTQLDAGEVHFRCTLNGAPGEGYYFAATRSTRAQGSGLWNVEHLYGFLARSDLARDAQSALEHALQTFRLNERWVERQQNMTMETSRTVTRTNEAMMNILRTAFENSRSETR